MSKILSGLMQKMHLQDDEYQEEFDDSAEYDEDDMAEDTPKSSGSKTKKEKSASRFSQKKTVKKKAVEDMDDEFDDIDDDEDTSYSSYSSRSKRTASSGRNKIVSMRKGTTDRSSRSYYTPSMEVCILKPIDADSAEEVCDAIIDGKAVMVNFANVSEYDRQRIIDMASGTTYAVEGRLKLVNDMIAIFTPRDIDITGDLEEYASSTIRVPSLGYQDYEDEEE